MRGRLRENVPAGRISECFFREARRLMAKKATARVSTAKAKSVRGKKGLTKADVLRKAKQLSNWGKWGKNDELGVLNYIRPEDIVEAGKLIRKGKVFRLGLNLDENGPQRGLFGGRWNPMHQMLATGTRSEENP